MVLTWDYLYIVMSDVKTLPLPTIVPVWSNVLSVFGLYMPNFLPCLSLSMCTPVEIISNVPSGTPRLSRTKSRYSNNMSNNLIITINIEKQKTP